MRNGVITEAEQAIQATTNDQKTGLKHADPKNLIAAIPTPVSR